MDHLIEHGSGCQFLQYFVSSSKNQSCHKSNDFQQNFLCVTNYRTVFLMPINGYAAVCRGFILDTQKFYWKHNNIDTECTNRGSMKAWGSI